jgi:FKBP-type peptidyl-prolyl cis-trans isomerase
LSPAINDQVLVNYLGITPDGKVIDDTYSSGNPAMLHISNLGPVLQDVLLNMNVGAEWEVYIPEEQRVYGAFSRKGDEVEGPVLYLIELLEIRKEKALRGPAPLQ